MLEDQLRERRERLQENRKKEETQRLTDLGYTGGGDIGHRHHVSEIMSLHRVKIVESCLADLMRKEKGVMLFR